MKILNIKQISIIAISIFTLSSTIVLASEASDNLIKEYQKAGAGPFSEKNGQSLWEKKVDKRSCTNCHSMSVKNIGKHQRTNKEIKPMAPSVNPERLTEEKKIKKWLVRNCKWTFKRECTPQEKGDILTWLSKQ
jgi:hypothetical protein